MIYLVDGSNLLGQARVDREGDTEKRRLTQRLASFARQKGAKLTLFFDGPPSGNFAAKLGSVEVRFSGAVPADNLIQAMAARLKGRVYLVTSDRGLAMRCARRELVVIAPSALLNELEQSSSQGPDTTDWEQYFSDPKNKADF